MRLTQKLQLELSLTLGYTAEFYIRQLDEGPHLLLMNSVNNSNKAKTYRSFGRLSSLNPSIDEIRKLIWEEYKSKNLESITLSYQVFDPNNNKIDGGYIQDKFGKGLLNPEEFEKIYSKIKEWKELKF